MLRVGMVENRNQFHQRVCGMLAMTRSNRNCWEYEKVFAECPYVKHGWLPSTPETYNEDGPGQYLTDTCLPIIKCLATIRRDKEDPNEIDNFLFHVENAKQGDLRQVSVDIPLPKGANATQQRAIEGCSELRVSGVQGPPGTGKTTVLTALARMYLALAKSTSYDTRNVPTLTSRCKLEDN